MVQIGNAPCSWGVEHPDDPRNPPWRQVLKDCAEAGYRGIELGPVGFLPENPEVLAEALDENGLTLIGGEVYRPFHDPDEWLDVVDGAERTCKTLASHGAGHLVLIDAMSPRRAAPAGRAGGAEQMDAADWTGFRNRIVTIAKIGAEVYGLTVSIHAHAGGFIAFEPELDRLLQEVAPDVLKICFDTGHHSLAGHDPVAFMKRHMGRISHVHLRDVDPAACGPGMFCALGRGQVNFEAVRETLRRHGYHGWCTVEQDCDPTLNTSPVADARANRDYLTSIGFD
jgi:inosose dehydratase